jgi:hypothetical protein
LLPAAKPASLTLAFAAMLWAVSMPLCAAGPTGVATKDEVIARQFAEVLDNSNSQDSQSPDTLNTRLGFAEFLAKSEGGDCHLRLENAHNQLEIARASQAGIALPSPWREKRPSITKFMSGAPPAMAAQSRAIRNCGRRSNPRVMP